MLRNSFKFLSLALAASLIVAPISAIDWNSNSSRFGLGLAIAGTCWIVYNLCFGNSQKEKPVVTFAEKQRMYNILANDSFINQRENDFVNKIVNRIGDVYLGNHVKKLSKIREDLIQARANDNSNPFVPNNKKLLQTKLADRDKITSLENKFISLVNLIKGKLEV